MILILSVETDSSTNDIIDWLFFFKTKFFRVNADAFLDDKLNTNISLKNALEFTIRKNKTVFKSITCKVVWYRRWSNPNNFNQKLESDSFNFQILRYSITEFHKFFSVLFSALSHCKWLNHPKEDNWSKLQIMSTAQKFGLKIPSTQICTSKKDIKKFLQNHKRVITKSIGNVSFFKYQKNQYALYTSEVTSSDLNKLDMYFFPSLLQEYMEKEFEIRIFFLEISFYAMAIFSQSNPQTQIDFRRYDNVKPNRTVPYKLPIKIEDKLRNLILELGIKSGSVDMIKRPDGEYVFLEINPVGQFSMTSIPCNYYLEKKIGEYLIKESL